MGYLDSLLGDREHIVFQTRQHFYVLLQALVLDSVAIALLLLLAANTTPYLGLFAFLPLLHLLWKGLDWKQRLYVVTNRRIIEVSGLLEKRTSDSSLEKVNDVILTQSVFGRLLNYGDMEILTGAAEGIAMLRTLANPLEFKRQMLNQKEAMRSDEAIPVRSQTPLVDAAQVPAMIRELDTLRQRGLLTEAEFAAKKRELLDRL